MRRRGRLFALPLLLLALALQGLAPAQVEAMPRDAFGLPICTSSGLGGGSHRPDPAHQHDCCAAACALAGLMATPAAAPTVALAAHWVFIARSALGPDPAPKAAPPHGFQARGPPAAVSALT